MRIVVGPGGPHIKDPADFTRFSVTADCARYELHHVLARADAGRFDGEHAWISPTWIQEAVDADDAWTRKFERMQRLAHDHGWIDRNTGLLRAHVSPVDLSTFVG